MISNDETGVREYDGDIIVLLRHVGYQHEKKKCCGQTCSSVFRLDIS